MTSQRRLGPLRPVYNVTIATPRYETCLDRTAWGQVGTETGAGPIKLIQGEGSGQLGALIWIGLSN